MQTEKIECELHGLSPIEYLYTVHIGFHSPECKRCFDESIQTIFKMVKGDKNED